MRTIKIVQIAMLLLLNVGIFTMVHAEFQERMACRVMVEHLEESTMNS